MRNGGCELSENADTSMRGTDFEVNRIINKLSDVILELSKQILHGGDRRAVNDLRMESMLGMVDLMVWHSKNTVSMQKFDKRYLIDEWVQFVTHYGTQNAESVLKTGKAEWYLLDHFEKINSE